MPSLTPFLSQSYSVSANNIPLLLLPHVYLIVFMFHITITGLTKQKQTIYLQGNVFWMMGNIWRTKLPNCDHLWGHLTVEGCAFVFFVCEWSAGDYSSNDNSTYGDWINLPEHRDHKSNLRMIILLPDEELIPNVLQWSEKRRCVCGGVILRRGMFTSSR